MSVQVQPATAIETGHLAGPGLRAFFRIAGDWRLSNDEQATLLSVSKATLARWKGGSAPALSVDQLDRLSYILGIYKALQILLPNPAAADGWVRRANDAALFGGKSALDRMLSGRMEDLLLVRRYLDAQRGGWA